MEAIVWWRLAKGRGLDFNGLKALHDGAMPYPFQRVREMLAGIAPGRTPEINLTLGEPREAMPEFVAAALSAPDAAASLGKYPNIKGSDVLREAISDWLARRYGLDEVKRVDPDREILPTNGSRDGLFFASIPAVGRKAHLERPAIVMCNPYYAAYIGAAFATNAEPVYLNATEKTGFLPDLDWLEAQGNLLARTAAFYLCSPANPQGRVASRDYTERALKLARRHNFMLFFDECYSEIYDGEPPTGGLEVAVKTPQRFENIVVFNSLSKRSNLPGLRSGFCAGDGDFVSRMAAIRNLIGPQMPGPVQAASAVAWADEAHVDATRAAYREKFDICDRVLKGRYGYRRPEGGFFLWLNVSQYGGGEEATVTLWKRSGVRVLPGSFLSQDDAAGENPGADYIRVALVQDAPVIEEALTRMVGVLQN